MEGDAHRLSDDELLDDECAEQWERETDDPDVLGLCADKWLDGEDWPWQVTVSAMEFVREEPLEGELRREVFAALSSVPNVVEVAEEDREVWVIAGEPSGEALIRAAGHVLDEFADRIRAHIEGFAGPSGRAQRVGPPTDAVRTYSDATQDAANIVIEALLSLQFNRREYTTKAGIKVIDFVCHGGTHTLVFADSALSSFQLHWSGGSTTPPTRGTVELEAGKDYIVYCDQPAHRAAGERAVIHVAEPGSGSDRSRRG
jgi:hypothetical protein